MNGNTRPRSMASWIQPAVAIIFFLGAVAGQPPPWVGQPKNQQTTTNNSTVNTTTTTTVRGFKTYGQRLQESEYEVDMDNLLYFMLTLIGTTLCCCTAVACWKRNKYDERLLFTGTGRSFCQKLVDVVRIHLNDPDDLTPDDSSAASDDKSDDGKKKDKRIVSETSHTLFAYGTFFFNVGCHGIYLYLVNYDAWTAGYVLGVHSALVCMAIIFLRCVPIKGITDKSVDVHPESIGELTKEEIKKLSTSNIYRNLEAPLTKYFWHPRGPIGVFFMQVTLFYHYMEGIHSEFTEEKPKLTSAYLMFYWISGMCVLPAISQEIGTALPGFMPFQSWSHVKELKGFKTKMRFLFDVIVNAGMVTFIWYSLPIFLMKMAGSSGGLDFVMNLTAVVFIVQLDETMNAEVYDPVEDKVDQLMRDVNQLKRERDGHVTSTSTNDEDLGGFAAWGYKMDQRMTNC